MIREQVRTAQGLLDWSQEDLARVVGVLRRVILDYEAGRRTPRGDTLDEIADAPGQAGVRFVENPGGLVGVALTEEGLRAVRAREQVGGRPSG